MTSTATRAGATSKRAFARHFIEMVVVMLLGMAVFAGLAQLAFSLADSSLGEQSAGLRVSLMGLCMTIPMVAWMAWHHHAVAQTVEMAGCRARHPARIPAMLAVMPWRYDVYARAPA